MTKKIMILAFIAVWVAGCATTKKMADTLVGDWEYTVTGTPEGDFTGILTLLKEGDGYAGVLKAANQETPLKNVVIEGNKLTSNFDYMSYTVNMAGVIEGESMTGEMTVDYNGFPFTAKKVKK
jgi:hypothetical protein